MENQLIFVEECLASALQAERPLKVIQFWHQHPIPAHASLAELHAFVAPHGPDSFTGWRNAIDGLDAVEDKLEMLDRFAAIEDEFETLEKMIDDTVSDIDQQIQHEIDVARGK
jgi:hypothetical protein